MLEFINVDKEPFLSDNIDHRFKKSSQKRNFYFLIFAFSVLNFYYPCFQKPTDPQSHHK